MQLYIVTILLVMMLLLIPITDKLINMGALLLLSSLVSTLILAILINSWFAFILFLIYITGLLVVFSYMLAMSPNSYQSKSVSFKIIGVILSLVLMFIMISYNHFKLPNCNLDFEWEVMSIFNLLNLVIYLFMTIILLMALILVVSMCYKSRSPLRKFL